MYNFINVRRRIIIHGNSEKSLIKSCCSTDFDFWPPQVHILSPFRVHLMTFSKRLDRSLLGNVTAHLFCESVSSVTFGKKKIQSNDKGNAIINFYSLIGHFDAIFLFLLSVFRCCVCTSEALHIKINWVSVLFHYSENILTCAYLRMAWHQEKGSPVLCAQRLDPLLGMGQGFLLLRPPTSVPSYFSRPSALTANRWTNVFLGFLSSKDKRSILKNQHISKATTYSFHRVVQGLPVMKWNRNCASFPKVIVLSFSFVAQNLFGFLQLLEVSHCQKDRRLWCKMEDSLS